MQGPTSPGHMKSKMHCVKCVEKNVAHSEQNDCKKLDVHWDKSMEQENDIK